MVTLVALLLAIAVAIPWLRGSWMAAMLLSLPCFAALALSLKGIPLLALVTAGALVVVWTPYGIRWLMARQPHPILPGETTVALRFTR